MLTQKIRRRVLRSFSAAALLGGLVTTPAEASNVLLAGAGSEKVHSTNIVFMQKDGMTAVTVHPDYQGPLSKFAVIIPVPKDVTEEMVTTLKREYSDRVAHVSAPKYAEFWEMDPCDFETKHEQEWERNMKASSDTAFMGAMKTDPSKKVAKEMLLDVEAKQKKGEYKETFVGDAAGIKKWLGEKEYELPKGGAESLSEYESKGYQFVALDVNVDTMELIGADRASLSPIRYWTKEPANSLPTRFGLPSAAPQQELQIFAMVPEQRMQVKNYKTLAAPTNLSVTEKYKEPSGRNVNLKERMGELFAALHDRFLQKNPSTFLLEYAWTTSDCGKPCPTEPLLPHEILSLGADVFEEALPDEVRNPEPPEPTEKELAKLEVDTKAAETPAEKKEVKETWEADRAELAARKAMIARNEYILSRLHYRYGAKEMPKDVELDAGGPIAGGNALPAGEHGAADTNLDTSAKKNEFQTRFNGLFPNIKVVKCDAPKHHRWGKQPRHIRQLNKIWVAEDLARRDRKRVDPNQAVVTPVPNLGIPGLLKKEEEPAAAAAEDKPKDEGGLCHYRPAPVPAGGWAALGALMAAAAFWRRRRSRV